MQMDSRPASMRPRPRPRKTVRQALRFGAVVAVGFNEAAAAAAENAASTCFPPPGRSRFNEAAAAAAENGLRGEGGVAVNGMLQ